MKEPRIHCSASLGPSSIPKPSTSVPSSSLLHSTESLPAANPASQGMEGNPTGAWKETCNHGLCPCKACGFLLAFPRAKSLPSLSNSLKGKKKSKGPEMTGVGSTLPGYGQRAPRLPAQALAKPSLNALEGAARQQRGPQPGSAVIGCLYPSSITPCRHLQLVCGSPDRQSVPQTQPSSLSKPLLSYG